ncbi:MAG TPA: hypothetical protein VK981_17160 [Ramlibacter sp.]|nr:hypothetical protein [Ramlibacter sp.]
MQLRRGLLWLVLFALVSAQTLGLMHRVVHPSNIEHAVESPARGWVLALVGQHDDSGCRVFDQLGQGGFLPSVPVVPLPLLLPSFVFQWFQGEVLARWAALFDARGPPLLR